MAISPENEFDVIDATGKPAMLGSQPHPYRTKTRFRKVDGRWEPIEEIGQQSSFRRTSTPEERAAGREQVKNKDRAERRAMGKIIKAISKRQDIGDPSCRLSEGESFPLAEALRREGREDLIATVVRYRRLVALCEAEPLKGLDYSKADGGEVVRETKRLTPEADIDSGKASDWKSIPDGEIRVTTKIKKSRGAYASPAKRIVVSANDNNAAGSVIKTESLHVKLTDEVLNDHIDAKPILSEIRQALGPLLEPFEDAVLGGRTYSDVGRASGEKTQPAVAGKAIVGMACGSVFVKWQEIDRRERYLESIALQRFRNRAA